MSEEGTTRRLVAILAADVVDYSRRMHEDEAGTVAAWQSARSDAIDPTLEAHHGRVVKRTGDGFLAEFTTVEEAVRCAVALQEALTDNPLDFRMGINLGDITDDGDDIHGDGVNIAARLESLAEPGGILISDSVYNLVHNKLDLHYADLGEQQVKNIATPIRTYSIGTAPVPPPTTVEPVRSRGSVLASLVAIAVLAAGVLVWQPWAGPEKAEAPAPQTPPPEQAAKKTPGPKPAIAVLPFTNISADKEQEYFADGMTEDLITDLSKISDLNVISRSAISGYKGREINVTEVGTALGVRYVVEGSVRKAGDRVRINAKLTDATTGSNLWAERYDGDLKDIFALQDRVLEKLVGSLALTLTEKERRRLASRGTNSIAAHDLYLKGLYEESKFNRAGNEAAVGLYEQALSIDPDYPLPYARLSNILQLNARSGWSDDLEGDLRKAVELAEKSVALDSENPGLHWNLSRAVARIREPGAVTRGIEAMERAIELDPDFADAYAYLGVLYTGDGRAADGLRSVETAMRLNPRYPFWYLFMRAMARFMLDDYEQAAADLERALERSPTMLFMRWWLAASYVQLGRPDDAEWQVDELNSMGFTGSIKTITETQPIQHPPYVEKYIKALRKAGIPEDGAAKVAAPEQPAEPDKAAATEKPSVAVLPFVNMSGDAGQDYFSDGMTEDLITDLSKISALMVISRSSTFAYKGRSPKISDVAKELGVSHVVEGSVRRAGNRVRITAQLTDAASGAHIWAERYDREMKDIFALQDEVRGKIVAALAVRLTPEEEQRLARHETDNPEAYDLYLKGLQQESFFTKEGNQESRRLFEQAIALDPNFALAYASLAQAYSLAQENRWLTDQAAASRKAVELAEKAIELDSELPQAHWALGRIVTRAPIRDPERALVSLRRTVKLAPNYADGHAFLGNVLNYVGRAEEALGIIDTAIRINPRHPFWYVHTKGQSLFLLGRFEEAVPNFLTAIERNPTVAWPHLFLVATYGHLGRLDDAEWEREELDGLGQPLTINVFRKNSPIVYPEYMNLILDGMRKAGVPEGKEEQKETAADKPSVAVLPFTNMSGDKEQEYFSDGMTEDLITDLSKVSGLTVIARNSTFAYKGKTPDIRAVAKDLGVRYVLEGSVRKAGNRVRINAQLIDGETGNHLWADRYDGTLDDVFGLQDKVTAKIVTTLAVQLTAGEEQRIAHKETTRTEAYDEFLKGWEQYLVRSPEGFRTAIKHFKNAIALDPDYSRAYAALAATYWEVHNRNWHEDIGLIRKHDALYLAETMLENALKDPTPLALQISSILNSRQGSHENAIAEAERAIALDPNDADGYVAMASIKTLAGKPEDATPLIHKAMRLNPHFPSHYLYELGLAHFTLGQYSKAADVLERASALSPEDVWPSRLLLAVYGQLDRQADIKRVQGTIRPGWWVDAGPMTIKSIAFWYPFKKPEHANRLAEGLRKAGIPD